MGGGSPLFSSPSICAVSRGCSLAFWVPCQRAGDFPATVLPRHPPPPCVRSSASPSDPDLGSGGVCPFAASCALPPCGGTSWSACRRRRAEGGAREDGADRRPPRWFRLLRRFPQRGRARYAPLTYARRPLRLRGGRFGRAPDARRRDAARRSRCFARQRIGEPPTTWRMDARVSGRRPVRGGRVPRGRAGPTAAASISTRPSSRNCRPCRSRC